MKEKVDKKALINGIISMEKLTGHHVHTFQEMKLINLYSLQKYSNYLKECLHNKKGLH